MPLYSEDIIMARAIVRKLESDGWKVFIKREQGKFQCSFSREGLKIRGDYENSEHLAICSSARRIAEQVKK